MTTVDRDMHGKALHPLHRGGKPQELGYHRTEEIHSTYACIFHGYTGQDINRVIPVHLGEGLTPDPLDSQVQDT